MIGSLNMHRRLSAAALGIVISLVSTSGWAGVSFNGEQLTPKTPEPRKSQAIPVALITFEMLQPLEVAKPIQARLKAALVDRENLFLAEQAGSSAKKLKALRMKRDVSRQAVLSDLYTEELEGSSMIARSLLDWDEAQLIYEEDLAYYRKDLKRYAACKPKCEAPEKPYPDYGDLIATLEENMPRDDEERLQVYNLYIRGLLYEASGDEVGAVSAYGKALQIGQARLIAEIHTRIGDLESGIGNYEAAAHQYESVSFGEYYAESRVKQAWVYRQLNDCNNVLKVAARFRHTVSSQAEQKRFGPEMLKYETECAAFYLRMEQVVKIDPEGVSLVEQEVKALQESRRRQGSKTVVKNDFRICLADALQKPFEVSQLSLNLAGTTRDPELTWAGAADSADPDITQPEEVYAANIASCMARRLEMLPVVTKLSGSVTLIVP
jgi:tetratricopeptide (TPR) repeat protein